MKRQKARKTDKKKSSPASKPKKNVLSRKAPVQNAVTMYPDRGVASVLPIPTGGYATVLRSRLGFCLYKCALRLRALLDSAFLDSGMITPQFGILSILTANGPLSQVDIGQSMAIDKATMVKLIDSLEGLNMVRRTPHPQDRRVRIVELTAKGQSTFTDLLAKAKDVELTFTAKLSEAERETLRQLTSRLLD